MKKKKQLAKLKGETNPMLQLEISKQTQISKTTEALYHIINKGDLIGIKKALYPPTKEYKFF